MWIIENPDINATGFSRVLSEGKGRLELQLEPLSFVVQTKEEVDAWRLVPKFAQAENEGRVVVYETEAMPALVPEIPHATRPDRADDYGVAQQIVWCHSRLHQISLENINAYRAEPGSGREWEEEADRAYLRTRHRQVLEAAVWLFENVAAKMRRGLSGEQRERLAACKRQLKLIEKLM